jgi:hypothetical protein
VYRDQQIGDELELRSGAEFAAIVGRSREATEYLPAAIERAPLAAGVDGDILCRRLGPGSADRAIEEPPACARARRRLSFT